MFLHVIDQYVLSKYIFLFIQSNVMHLFWKSWVTWKCLQVTSFRYSIYRLKYIENWNLISVSASGLCIIFKFITIFSVEKKICRKVCYYFRFGSIQNCCERSNTRVECLNVNLNFASTHSNGCFLYIFSCLEYLLGRNFIHVMLRCPFAYVFRLHIHILILCASIL